jgi:hypothetical protein
MERQVARTVDELRVAEGALINRIVDLEAALTYFAAEIERVYGALPADRFPGPPTELVEKMRAAALRKSPESTQEPTDDL